MYSLKIISYGSSLNQYNQLIKKYLILFPFPAPMFKVNWWNLIYTWYLFIPTELIAPPPLDPPSPFIKELKLFKIIWRILLPNDCVRFTLMKAYPYTPNQNVQCTLSLYLICTKVGHWRWWFFGTLVLSKLAPKSTIIRYSSDTIFDYDANLAQIKSKFSKQFLHVYIQLIKMLALKCANVQLGPDKYFKYLPNS